MRTLIGLLVLGWQLGAQPRIPVWIDTDPSVAPGGHEVDDGIALLQAFASRELDIRGISIVFGNTDLATASRIGREIVQKFGPRGVGVYNGASGAVDLGQATGASKALVAELRQGHLTILALGPATNVATVVRNHPDLIKRIDQVVAVAGRRPGQRFLSGPSQQTPFRDLNFELDPEAFRVLLGSGVPLVLAPWEISSGVWLSREELEAASVRNPAMKWMYPAFADWLDLWKREFGAAGFNPFDALAVGFLTNRQSLKCARLSAAIETAPDDAAAVESPRGKPYLVVRPFTGGQARVTYCSAANADFKADLLRRLSKETR